jgi:hypothetical protein
LRFRFPRCDQRRVRRLQIGKDWVSEATAKRFGAAAGGIARQRAWIKIIPLGKAQHDRRGERALVPLNQIEIAWRDIKALCHNSLGKPRSAADAADGVSGKKFLGGHADNLSHYLHNDKNLQRSTDGNTRKFTNLSRRYASPLATSTQLIASSRKSL